MRVTARSRCLAGLALAILLAASSAAAAELYLDPRIVTLLDQGLVGAKLHAQKAAAERWPIEAVLNNDIVGNSRGGNGVSGSGSVRVFSEGPEDSPSVARNARVNAAALAVMMLEIRTR